MAKKNTTADGKPVDAETGKPVLANVQAREACINDGFEKRFKLERWIKELEEEHLSDPKGQLKKLKRDMKTDTGIDGKDLDNWYRIFKREQEAKAMDDDDSDRILDNIREVFEALKKGETVDFLTAMNSDKQEAA